MPLSVGLLSLGCARTLVDSEVALGGLKKEGYRIVADASKADIAIVNTCGFIESAKVESIDAILRLCELKKKGRISAVVVLGCLAQRYGKELRQEIGDEVDAIIGTDSYEDLPRLLKPLHEKKRVFEINGKPRYLLNENSPRVTLTPAHTAYVKISEGCINACSYCVIPMMKGPHRSRSIVSVLEEIKKIVSQRPISEINLIGQDTAAYGFDLDRTFQLPELLNRIAGLDAVPWVRLLYAHPGHVTEELIDAIASHPALCKYIDFPIEHSHDRMLAKMNRGVTRAKMEWGLDRMRTKIPGVNVRTTVIVGFPGETEDEFQDLMDFLKERRFERLGAFMFSEEEGARAYGLPDPISPKLKQERFDAVMAQQRDISSEIGQSLTGRTLRVLIDGSTSLTIPSLSTDKEESEPGVYYGRTEGDAPEVDGQVIVHSDKPLLPGEFKDVLITDALEYDLIGAVSV